MNDKKLRALLTAVQCGSFGKATAQLGYTQSAMTHMVNRLEAELGCTLLVRGSHGVRLSEEGEKLLPLAQQILRLAAEATHISGNTAPEGLVRIAIAESLASWEFHSRFKDFHEKYPGIRLKIIATSTDEMFQMLGQNQVDIVYTLDRRIFNHNYVTAFEAPVDIHFVTGAGHPLAGQTQITLEQILEYPLILTEKNMSYRAALDDLLSQNGRETMPIMEVGDTQLIRNLLCQGLGISYLPEFVIAEDLAKGSLVSLPMAEIQPDIWRQLLYHRNKWISPELKCVIKYLQEE